MAFLLQNLWTTKGFPVKTSHNQTCLSKKMDISRIFVTQRGERQGGTVERLFTD